VLWRGRGKSAPADPRRAGRRSLTDCSIQARSPSPLDDVRREADRVRRGADEYAAQVLRQLEAEVERVLAAIHRGQQVLKTSGGTRGRSE
jgi:hypothetical protein